MVFSTFSVSCEYKLIDLKFTQEQKNKTQLPSSVLSNSIDQKE